VLDGHVDPPSKYAPDVAPALEQIVLRGLHLDPRQRFQTAGEMALAIEDVMPMVGRSKIGRWVEETATQRLAIRSERMAAMESNSAIRAPRLPEPATEAAAQQASDDRDSGNMPTMALGSGVISAPQLSTSPGLRPAVAPERSRWAVTIPVVAGLLTLAVAAVGVAFVLLGHRMPFSRVAGSAPSATTSAAPVATTPETASATATSAATASASTAPFVPPVPTTAVTLLPTVAPPRAPVGAPPVFVPQTRPTTPAPTAHPAVDCNPPYYFNAQGDRLFKKECM